MKKNLIRKMVFLRVALTFLLLQRLLNKNLQTVFRERGISIMRVNVVNFLKIVNRMVEFHGKTRSIPRRGKHSAAGKHAGGSNCRKRQPEGAQIFFFHPTGKIPICKNPPHRHNYDLVKMFF